MPSLVFFYSCFSLIKITVINIEWSTEKIRLEQTQSSSEKRPALGKIDANIFQKGVKFNDPLDLLQVDLS